MVDVPDGATPGDHAAGIMATVYEERQPDPSQPVDVEFRTGTRLYVRVSGDATASLGIGSMKVVYNAGRNPFDGSADVTFRVDNLGSLRLGATATVRLDGPFGVGAHTVTVPAVAEVLPGGQLSVTTRIDGVAAMGRLHATVDLVPDAVDGVGSAPTVRATSSTTAVPMSLLLLALFAGLVVLVARAIRRHRLETSPEPAATWTDLRTS